MTLTDNDAPGAHLNAEEMAAFVDRRLSPAETARASGHLAVCDTCRLEAAEVRRLIPRAGPLRRWWWTAPAAAAVLATLLLLRPDDAVNEGRRLRVSLPDTLVELSEPGPGERILAPRLSWRSVAAGAAYRVTVTDTTGAVVWTAAVSDTTALPTDLPAGGRFLWYVEALWPDGRTATSVVRSFVLGP